MSLRRFSLLSVLASLLISSATAQQFRKPENLDKPLAKSVLERRLRSAHPSSPTKPGDVMPGKYLLDRPAARKAELQSRIRATSGTRRSSALSVLSSASTNYPGIQLRPSAPGGLTPVSVVTGDFNRDGHQDYITANALGNDLWFYAGKGDGTFQLPHIIPLTKGLTPVFVAAADLRNNGILDLIVAEWDTATVGVLLGNGDGTFGYEKEYSLPQPPSAIVVDDFTHHGHPDVAVAMQTGIYPDTLGIPHVAVLPGDGTGALGTPVITKNWGYYSSATSLSSADLNGDGLPDLLVNGPGMENTQIWTNNGDNTFTAGKILRENYDVAGAFSLSLGAVLADVNKDGCPDAVIADLNTFVWVGLGDCNGGTADFVQVPTGDSNSWVAVADMNGDGNLDIVTTSLPVMDPIYGGVSGDTSMVAFGDGKGGFTPARRYPGTGQSYSIAVADFNGDHFPDAVSASPDTDTTTVFANDGAGSFGFPQGEWIGLTNVGVINSPLDSVSFKDLNRDGKPDLFTLNIGYNGEYFLNSVLGDGTGRFAFPVASDAGTDIVSHWFGDYKLGDFRGTGNLDFVAVGLSLGYSGGSEFIAFAQGHGDGTFGQVTITPVPGAQGAIAVGDFNHDGKLDFAAIGKPAMGMHQVSVFLGNGNGTFRSAGSNEFNDDNYETIRVFAGDYNRDGKTDLVVFNSGNGYWTSTSTVWEFLGKGDGTFQPGVQLFTGFQPMTMADVNNDGFADIVRYDFFWPDGTTQTLGPPTFTTYLGQANGSFVQSDSKGPYSGISYQSPPFMQLGDPTASSKVADLNGDGKPDEIALQFPQFGTAWSYDQILSGNGDGTFTPTYDVFPFLSSGPGYAQKLDGGTATSLVRLAGATSAVDVYKGATAPALQLALEDEQVPANSSCGWVFPNVASASDRTVALASSVSGVSVPASVTIPAGALQAKFCYTLDASYDWHHVFDVRASLSGDTAIAYASQKYFVGFKQDLSPVTAQTIYGTLSTAPVTVTLTAAPSYHSTVHLSCTTLPPGATCSFGSSSLVVAPGVPASTTVVVHTADSETWWGPVVITASDNNVTDRSSFPLTVVKLAVFGQPEIVTTTLPGEATWYATLISLGPVTGACAGLPAGVTCTASGDQVSYPSNGIMSYTVDVPAGTPAADYPFTISVSSGPQQATANMTLKVTDFSLSPPSTTPWGVPGVYNSFVVGATAINGFNATVDVTCTINFAGSCSSNGNFIAPYHSGVSVAVMPAAGVVGGTYTVDLTVSRGPDSHHISVPFAVGAISGTLDKNSVTVSAGSSGTVNATVTGSAGFGGTVQLACSGPTTILCSFNPATVKLGSGSSQSVQITVKALSFASNLPHRLNPIGPFFAGLVPGALLLLLAGRNKGRNAYWVIGLTMALGGLWACGGGSSSGGGGGPRPPTSYAVDVTGTVVGTNYTQDFGTITVTVTH